MQGSYGFRVEMDMKDLAEIDIPANITYREHNGQIHFKARYKSPEEKGRATYEIGKLTSAIREKLGMPPLKQIK